MGLWKRGRRYWTQTVVNGVWIRRPLCPAGSTRATTNWQEAVGLEKELIRAALQGSLPTHSHSIKLFAAVDDYLKAKKATANTQRAIDFDRERLDVVKRLLGDVRLSAISSRVIEGFQAKRRLEGAGNRTVNMDVGALRQVLKRFKQWRRLEDDVKMLTGVRGRADRPGVDQRGAGTAAQGGRSQSGMGTRVVRGSTRSQYVNARCRSEARAAKGL